LLLLRVPCDDLLLLTRVETTAGSLVRVGMVVTLLRNSPPWGGHILHGRRTKPRVNVLYCHLGLAVSLLELDSGLCLHAGAHRAPEKVGDVADQIGQ